jgi:hypothetical protein
MFGDADTDTYVTEVAGVFTAERRFFHFSTSSEIVAEPPTERKSFTIRSNPALARGISPASCSAGITCDVMPKVR